VFSAVLVFPRKRPGPISDSDMEAQDSRAEGVGGMFSAVRRGQRFACLSLEAS
jgi:hypothetical protein